MSDAPAGAATSAPAEGGPDIDQALAAAASFLSSAGRSELVERVQAARVRASRPTTVVCVVGEFKQGKSSLVNALVGEDLCPVDDDIATATLTLVRHGEQRAAVVRYSGDDEPTAEVVPVERIADFITEQGDSGSRRIDRVDVAIPSPLLAGGLALVDTPGMGGLGAGHAAATLSFLPFADGLVFVSDASSELSAPEIEFLATALDRCPDVVMVSTKTDITPDWRRIVDLDSAHLGARDLDIPIIPVSAALRTAAFTARDRELNERSGVPELLGVLDARIIGPARSGAATRAASEASGMIRSMESALQSELAALSDPADAERLRSEANEATQRLESLRSGGARWQTVLGDRIADLSTDATHRFRGAIRETTRRIEEQIETLKTPAEWDELSRELQTAVADAVAVAFTSAERARGDIRVELAELLAADDVVGPTSDRSLDMIDTAALWRSRDLDPAASSGGKAFRTGLTGLRGAQGGVMMFGISSQFLPQAAAVFIASNPVLLGAGAVFGGFQLMEDRKRKLQMRRQSARTQLRQFTDDVQFEVGNELTRLLRSIQRDLRDEFIELIGELQSTWTTAAQQAQQAVTAGESAMKQRTDEIRSLLSTAPAVVADLERIAAGGEGTTR